MPRLYKKMFYVIARSPLKYLSGRRGNLVNGIVYNDIAPQKKKKKKKKKKKPSNTFDKRMGLYFNETITNNLVFY